MLKTNRKTEYPIQEIFTSRWSARAFSQEPVSDTELMRLFEAARWAQNSFNNQPWRFIFARNGSSHWQKFLDLIEPGNKIWAQHARVLLLVISKKTFDYNGTPSKTHTFDTGAACQNMALQGASMDIVCHGMEGFDYDRARLAFKIPDEYQVEAMFAIGKMGKREDLPEKLRTRETPPDRKRIKDFVFENEFVVK